jgi:uncharacterized protein YdhG (YjbR/CyaY superfamily)/predicted GIY-YIG superfamily endonuclease
MYYTYILECSDGSLYTGWTDDIDKRIRAHNAGSGSKYTRSRLPAELLYSEAFNTKSDAMRRECAIKKLKRSQKLELIEKKPENRRKRVEEKEADIRSIDDYIAQFPCNVQQKLQVLRQTIKEAAPEAIEKISYSMPAFFLQKNLVHFAAFKNHIGFYPAPSAIEEFKDELDTYKTSKGAVQFPIDKPLPYDLIVRIVGFRVTENLKNQKS